MADSLPQSVLHSMEAELVELPDSEQASERRRKIESYLDAGMGCCALRHPAVAAVVQETLLKFDGEKYQLMEWCIMPNHVHVLIHPKIELGRILQSW
ncbi:MAG TPA: transposase, partial [Opitutae bacterium]|nr:transposase [Opitutae bacterium]